MASIIENTISNIKEEIDYASESLHEDIVVFGDKTSIVGKDCNIRVAKLRNPEIFWKDNREEHTIRLSGDFYASPFREYEKIIKKRHTVKYENLELWPAIVDEYREKGKSEILEHFGKKRRFKITTDVIMWNDLNNIHDVYPYSKEARDGIFFYNVKGSEMQPVRGYTVDDVYIDDPLQPVPLPVGIKAQEALLTVRRGNVKMSDGRKIEGGDKTLENVLLYIDNIESSIEYKRDVKSEKVAATENDFVEIIRWTPFIPAILASEFLTVRFRVAGAIASAFLLYGTYRFCGYIKDKYGKVDVDVEKRLPLLHTEVKGDASFISEFMGSVKAFKREDYT